MAWDDAPPTQNEISATSHHAWDSAPPSKEELARVAPSSSNKMDEAFHAATKRMNEAGDASNDALFDTLTAGHLPQIKAKIKQIAAGEGFSNDDNYVKRRDQEIADMKERGEKYPVAKAVGTAGGFLAPLLATGGASAAAEGAEAVPFITRLGKSVLHSAKMGAVYGAAQNPGDKEGVVDPLQLSERVEGAGEGVKFGAKLGVGLPLVAAGIQGAGVPAKWAAQKVGKIFANIGEETTGRYLENPEAINNAPSRENISNRILELKKTADDNVAKAHEDLSTARQSLAENKVDTRSGLQDQKFDTGRELNEAQANFNEKKQQFKETLQKNNLTAMAGEVHDAVGQLKDKVVQGSKDAYDILENAKGDVSIDPLTKLMQKHYEAQFINGVPKNDLAAQSAQEIRAMQMRLFEMTKQTEGKLSLPQAKQMLQGLDETINYNSSRQAGAFAPQTDRALSEIRHAIDQDVKTQVPEYRAKMEQVSEQVKLLKDASKLYGTPEKAISNLNNIDSEKGQAIHVPLLKGLSDHTGKDLREPVAGYLLNQRVLSTPSLFDEMIGNTPEAKALAGAKSKMEGISNPEYARTVSEKANSPLQAKVTGAESRLEATRDKQKIFSGITPDSVTGKTKALNGANSYGAEERFGKIDKEHGTNFEKEIEARNDADQFSKTDTHGSRKSMVGGSLGALIGWLGGKSPESAAIGYAAGNAAGAAADRYSGQAFKMALDKGKAVGQGLQTASKAIENVPAQGVISRAKLTGSAPFRAADNPKKGPEKWANDGFQKLLDHADGDEKESIEAAKEKLMSSAAGKKLLISASDLKVGSKAMDNLLAKIKSEAEK